MYFIDNNNLETRNITLAPLSLSLLLMFCILLSSCAASSAKPNTKSDSVEKAEITNKIEKKPEAQYDKWSKHDVYTIKENQKNRPEETLTSTEKNKEIVLQKRMFLKDIDNTLPLDHIGKKFSFRSKEVSLKEAFNKFAFENKLHIIVDQDVSGDTQVDFKNESLEKAIELILGAHHYYWHWDDGILRISQLQTKTFVLDYLRLVRSGTAYNNSSNIDTLRESPQSAPSASSIQQTDNVAFWDELEGQLSAFVSDHGRLVINRLSGTIQFTDLPSRINEVNSFLQSLQSALHRQVIIDARIMEVTLRDENALGIDWAKISVSNILTGSISTIVPDNGFGIKANTLNIESFDGLLNALEEQGKVRIVSQPRIRTMNNQPSLIKVGTDKTFFTKSSTRTINLAGLSDEVITEKPKIITEGLVLSLTPQISQDRWVMLDISPVITRIVETTISSIGSTAPVLDIKQASTLVRARDGEVIILGGLIQDDEIKTERSVPYLSEIPWLGKLFQGHYNTKIKKELVIFLVPRIVI